MSDQKIEKVKIRCFLEQDSDGGNVNKWDEELSKIENYHVFNEGKKFDYKTLLVGSDKKIWVARHPHYLAKNKGRPSAFKIFLQGATRQPQSFSELSLKHRTICEKLKFDIKEIWLYGASKKLFFDIIEENFTSSRFEIEWIECPYNNHENKVKKLTHKIYNANDLSLFLDTISSKTTPKIVKEILCYEASSEYDFITTDQSIARNIANLYKESSWKQISLYCGEYSYSSGLINHCKYIQSLLKKCEKYFQEKCENL